MAKGRGAEWEIARMLSVVWDDSGRDDIFEPTNASGAQFTSRKKVGKNTAYQGGDITFSDPVGKPLIDKWNIECKTGYSKKKKIQTKKSTLDKSSISVINRVIETPWDVMDYIDSQQNLPQLQDFWQQSKDDSQHTKREPILIFRRNKKKICICMSSDYFIKIRKQIKNDTNFDAIYIASQKFGENLIIINFSEFLIWCENLSELIRKV